MNTHDYGYATSETLPPSRWMPLPTPPLSDSTGGRVMAHRMASSSRTTAYTLPKRKSGRRRLPRSLVDYWMPFGLIIGLFGGIWAVYTY